VERISRIVLQQLRQRGSSGLVHGGSHSGLDRFQIEPTVIATLLKNNPQEPVYFAGNFFLDCRRRFFPGLSARSARRAADDRSFG
jgi:hypothetical protein